MIDLEQRLAALADQPTTGAPTPLEQLERRAVTLRRRRVAGYLATGVIVVLGVAAMAVPLLSPAEHLTQLRPANQGGDAPVAPSEGEQSRGGPDREAVPLPGIPAPGPSEAPDGLPQPPAEPRVAPQQDENEEAGAGGSPSAASNPRAELVLERTRVLPGERVPFTAINTGDVLLAYDARYRIKRQDNREYGPHGPWQDWLRTLGPGERDGDLSMSTEGLPPGRYWLIKEFQAEEWTAGEDGWLDRPPGWFETWTTFTVIGPQLDVSPP